MEGGLNMNKLYTIRFLLSNGYVISTWYGWSQEDIDRKMALNPEWTFTLAEDNDIHQIWEAR